MTDISEEIAIDKTSLSRECMICHYWYFKDIGFRFKSNICNECSIECIFSGSKRVGILNAKGVYLVLAEIKLLIFLMILF